MCPDPQLLSIYMDGELPSPWKEKMDSHLSECPECMEKFKNFKHVQELFKKDTTQKRTIVESFGHVSEEFSSEQELMEASMKRVWQKLEEQSKGTYRVRSSGVRSYGARLQLRPAVRKTENLWKHRLSIPMPVAAAAAAVIIVALGITVFLRSGSVNNNTFASTPPHVEPAGKTNFAISSEEEVTGVIPTGNINDVLQYLTSNGTDIIILQLPENSNFSRAGEPAIIKAADYSRRNQ
jgi:anti-sigma factor RsiW